MRRFPRSSDRPVILHNIRPDRTVIRLFYFLLIVLLAAGCVTLASAPSISVKSESLPSSADCQGQFIPHDLPHITAAAVARVAYFFSNGSGLAVNDLDNDGDLDLVLGNLLGPNHIFWNEGDWHFRPDVLFEGSTRAITTVDVNGDGWLDIVTTARIGDVRYWRNTGKDIGTRDQFVADRLLGVDALAYALNWTDFDADGDLDLITASYDASLEKQMGQLYKQSGQSGVFVHENQGGRFASTRLASVAQALALDLFDADMDGRLDILVGNDFDVPDQVWLARDDGWEAATPFAVTTHSTMSFDSGDIDNDGVPELFAADMHPYSDAPDIMDQWQPVIDTMPHNLPPDDPQKMLNVLQTRNEAGQLVNHADVSGLAATGWSWSGKFGDLNQDGFLDFYIVNGMIAREIFSHLPDDELVEENQAFWNNEGAGFVLAPEWRLGSTRGGRSMSMADLDGDGDLDIVINNLRASAQIFENQLCAGASLQVDLRWPTAQNTHALGAVLTLQTDQGSYTRTLRASSGYLSGDPAQVHFGLPENSRVNALAIRWPDGATSVLNELMPNSVVQVTRN